VGEEAQDRRRGLILAFSIISLCIFLRSFSVFKTFISKTLSKILSDDDSGVTWQHRGLWKICRNPLVWVQNQSPLQSFDESPSYRPFNHTIIL
jgi:hypothetical protein